MKETKTKAHWPLNAVGIRDADLCADENPRTNLSWPFTPVDSHQGSKIVFNPQLAEFMDVKPGDTEGQSHVYRQQSTHERPARFKPVLLEGQPHCLKRLDSEVHSVGLSSCISLNFNLFSSNLIWLIKFKFLYLKKFSI